MTINFESRETEPLLPGMQLLLRQVVSTGLRMHSQYRKLHCTINITFVTLAEMQELNSQYRGKNTPTDVLSFPNVMQKPIAPGSVIPNASSTHIWNRVPIHPRKWRAKPSLSLGSIIICPDVAQAQADEYGHSLERELAFLTAHGFLHLIGYDHATSKDEAAMIAMQEKILTYVGVPR